MPKISEILYIGEFFLPKSPLYCDIFQIEKIASGISPKRYL
jgi:hypothetical protein